MSNKNTKNCPGLKEVISILQNIWDKNYGVRTLTVEAYPLHPHTSQQGFSWTTTLPPSERTYFMDDPNLVG